MKVYKAICTQPVIRINIDDDDDDEDDNRDDEDDDSEVVSVNGYGNRYTLGIELGVLQKLTDGHPLQ